MPPRRTDRPRAARLLLLLALALLAPLAQASEFAVREAEAHLTDGVYRLDARLSLSLNAGVEEALNNGVPITISVDIEVLETYPWLPDQTVASLEQRYLLRHHALSERYLVKNLNTGLQSSYSYLDEALGSIESLREIPILDQHLLAPGNDYYGRVRVRLDRESLPSPLRAISYISRDWQLKSDWLEWPLQPPHGNP